jgi:hypothetical protein
VTNGTRKLSAATPAFLTSVTTPSLTAPAATNLTLAGGAGTSSVILTPAGTGGVGIGTTNPGRSFITTSLDVLIPYSKTDVSSRFGMFIGGNDANPLGATFYNVGGSTAASRSFNIQATEMGSLNSILVLNPQGSNVGIGTADMTGLTGSGGLKIASTTAGSSGAGALVVAGGIGVAGASYFTSGVTVIAGSSNGFGIGRLSNATTYGAISFTPPDFSSLTMQGMYAGGGASTYITGTTSTILQAAGVSILTAASAGVSVTGTLSTTGAATFAGAVTIAGTVIHTLSATPASASATGTVGTMSWDASYIYICTAANTWKRVAIATW